MHPESDEQLLERIRAGDTHAFARLYERYKGRLYAYCCRLMRNDSLAEDAVHNAFLKIHAGVHSVNSPRAFSLWMFRIARNEALMILREKKKTVEPDEDAIWDDDTPLDILARKEDHECITHLLGQLSTVYREVIVLREFEQLSYAEIAEVTGTTVS